MADYRSRKSGWFSFKREVIILTQIALSLFLTLSLVTFNPYDSSWFFHQADLTVVSNACGRIGAAVAALCIYLFGGSALCIPLILCMHAWILRKQSWRAEWDRFFALICCMPTLSALCRLYRWDFVAPGAAGGWVGHAIVHVLRSYVDIVGTALILHTLLCVWLILIVRYSWIQFVYQAYTKIKMVSRALFSWLYPERLSYMAYLIKRPFFACYHWLYQLWQAEDVVASEGSIVEFESGQSLESAVKQIYKDRFWHRYEQQPPVEAEKPSQPQMLVSPASFDNSVPMQSADVEEQSSTYRVPDSALFEERGEKDKQTISAETKESARLLEEKLERFGVRGSIKSIKPGPVVTLFEYEPHIDTKLSKIVSLEDDLALALHALSIRIIAPIPGTSYVGFEVANRQRSTVYQSSIISSKDFKQYTGVLPLALGHDTVGNNVVVDLVKMPHLLIAGSTGSGKSVALNTMLISLLCSKTPEELRLILIDPKRLEFAAYADIAHLLFPIITDAHKAVPILSWLMQAMDERYEIMAQRGVRNIFDYKKLAETERLDPMPYIILVIDELADLMTIAGSDIEHIITRLSQMARAAGIHLVVATQRPSVDVITGLIKVNFPSRISFRVTSKVDSRTILDCAGADKLLGRGDMLFLDATNARLQRVHGAYVSDKEIAAVVNSIRAQRAVAYLTTEELELSADESDLSTEDQELYQSILDYLQEVDEVSISMLQRRFRIGFNRSARIIEALQAQGKIMPAQGGGKTRKVIRS